MMMVDGVGFRHKRGSGMGWCELAVAGLVIGAAGMAPAALPDINLGSLGTQGFNLNGNVAYQYLGRSVSGAGDVNGDGFADVVVGVVGHANPGQGARGGACVIFGGPTGVDLEFSALGTRGFFIEGAAPGDRAGMSVACAGDFNGDLLSDIVIGAPYAAVNGATNAGRVYIVFGKTNTQTVQLSAIGITGQPTGLRLDGSTSGMFLGKAVAPAGDLNADGFADVVIGVPDMTVDGRTRCGRLYVALGGQFFGNVSIDSLGNPGGLPGFRADGIDANDRAGWAVAGAGDVNGDGFGDLLVGSSHSSAYGQNTEGEAYVLFGQMWPPAQFPLGNLGTQGFPINGARASDFMGESVSGAGDVNGDGLSDLLLGVRGADGPNGTNAGAALVVLGRTTTTPVDAGNLGTDGFLIHGAKSLDAAGKAVAGLGDVNGDGLADIAISAAGADPGGVYSAGQVAVVFGRTDTTNLDLSALGEGGFLLNGSASFDGEEQTVAAAGDVNGDGLPDLIVGTPRFDRGVSLEVGRASVVYSPLGFAPNAPPLQATYSAWRRDSSLAYMGVSLTGMALDRTCHVDARLWIDTYDDGSDVAPTSPTMVTLTRSRQGVEGLPLGDMANVQWHLADPRPIVGDAAVMVRYTNAEVAGLNEPKLYLWWAPTPQGPWRVVPITYRDPSRNLLGAQVPALNGVVMVGEDHVAPVLTIVRAYPNPTDTQLPLWYVQSNEPVTILFDPKRMPLTGTLADVVDFPFAGGRGFDDRVLILVPGGTVEGTIGFELPYGTALDSEGNPSAAVSAPLYTISEGGAGGAAPGDVNGDGAVNVADITALGNHIAHGTPLP